MAMEAAQTSAAGKKCLDAHSMNFPPAFLVILRPSWQILNASVFFASFLHFLFLVRPAFAQRLFVRRHCARQVIRLFLPERTFLRQCFLQFFFTPTQDFLALNFAFRHPCIILRYFLQSLTRTAKFASSFAAAFLHFLSFAQRWAALWKETMQTPTALASGMENSKIEADTKSRTIILVILTPIKTFCCHSRTQGEQTIDASVMAFIHFMYLSNQYNSFSGFLVR